MSSRVLKIVLLVGGIAIVIVVVSLVVIRKNMMVKSSETTASQINRVTPLVPPTSPADIPSDPSSDTPFVAPINIERDPNAPPFISPDEALKLQGIESAPAPKTIAPAPPTPVMTPDPLKTPAPETGSQE